jgi:LPS-assembly lipoprotein
MSWRSTLAAGVLALAALALAGCGFQPLYGTTANGSRVAEVMSGVAITPIPGRVGQRVRNELIFENTGGGEAAPSQYRLDIIVKESVTDELVRQSGDSVGQVYQLTATFKLVNVANGQVMLEGGAMSRAAFERFQQVYSNVRARYDAENRAARTVAESIKVRVAAFLSSAA